MRAGDLQQVKDLCKMHNITASELRGCLKVKGATVEKVTPRKSYTSKKAAKI